MFWHVDEVRIKIFKNCNRCDLLNIALTCKRFYDDVKPLLWQKVRINARHLRDLPATVERTKYLKYTNQLVIADEKYFNRHSFLPALHHVLALCNTKLLNSLSVTNLNGHHGEVLTATPFRFKNITRLCLRNVNIPSGDWGFLFEFKLLQCLEIVSTTTLPKQTCNINQCDGLEQLTKLTQLTWYGCEVDVDVVCVMKGLRELTLGLHHSPQIDNLEANLYNLEQLIHLDLKDSFSVSSECFSRATELKNLQYLGVNNTEVTNEFITHISPLTTIRHLDVGRTKITEESLLLLSKFNDLRSLNIRGIKLSENGVMFIASTFLILQKLDISWCLCEDPHLTHLAALSHLKTLFIEESSELSDSCLLHVAAIPSLKELYMGWNNFTDVGLLHLKDIGLEYLNVEDCDDITDDGLRNAMLDTVVCYG